MNVIHSMPTNYFYVRKKKKCILNISCNWSYACSTYASKPTTTAWYPTHNNTVTTGTLPFHTVCWTNQGPTQHAVRPHRHQHTFFHHPGHAGKFLIYGTPTQPLDSSALRFPSPTLSLSPSTTIPHPNHCPLQTLTRPKCRCHMHHPPDPLPHNHKKNNPPRHAQTTLSLRCNRWGEPNRRHLECWPGRHMRIFCHWWHIWLWVVQVP